MANRSLRQLTTRWKPPWKEQRVVWSAVEATWHDYEAGVDPELSHGLKPFDDWSAKWAPALSYEEYPKALLDPVNGVAYDRTGSLVEPVAGFALERDPSLPRRRRPPDGAPLLRGAHLMAINGVERNVGHFLMDVIGSVLPVLERVQRRQMRLATTPLLRWQRDALAAFDIGDDCITELSGPTVVERLVVPSALDRSNIWAPRIPLLRELYAQLSAAVPDGAPGPPLVYAGRLGTRQPQRQAIGERELAEALAELGFVTIEGEELSIAEKVRTFRSARVVVGPYGANLAPIGVCRPDARVIVCAPSRMVEPWLPGVALASGLRLGLIVCPELTEADVGRSDYQLDVAAIVERARRAIAMG